MEEAIRRIAQDIAQGVAEYKDWRAQERRLRARDSKMKVTLPKLKCLEEAA